MLFLQKQKINVLSIIAVGMIVLGLVFYVFIKTLVLTELANELKIARDISRRILLIKSDSYHIQADIYSSFIDSDKGISSVDEIVKRIGGEDIDEMITILTHSKSSAYTGALQDAVEIKRKVNESSLLVVNCLMYEELKKCHDDFSEFELDTKIDGFSQEQIKFIDKMNKDMLISLNNLRVAMLVLAIIYLLLLFMIMNWIRSLSLCIAGYKSKDRK